VKAVAEVGPAWLPVGLGRRAARGEAPPVSEEREAAPVESRWARAVWALQTEVVAVEAPPAAAEAARGGVAKEAREPPVWAAQVVAQPGEAALRAAAEPAPAERQLVAAEGRQVKVCHRIRRIYSPPGMSCGTLDT
jgi:hypothetical protein